MLDLVLGDISHVLECLFRLSITIANPAPHDQFKSRAGADVLNHYEEYDIRHVREKFPHLRPDLTERLGKAITLRRQYFRYRKEHQDKLAEGLDTDEDVGDGRTTIASSVPKHLKDSVNEASALGILMSDLDDRSDTSTTSYAPSSVNQDQLNIPPIPNEYLDGPFMCPFCYLIIEVGSRQSWKKHVFGDLRPYVCLESCLAQEHQFSHRSDWARHMRQVHWRQWHCAFGCSGTFDDVQAFQDHMTTYATEVSGNSQEAIERLSSQTNARKSEGNCPLCFDKQITTARQYYSHVGNHLEQLSLFSLPHLEDEDGAEAGEDVIFEPNDSLEDDNELVSETVQVVETKSMDVLDETIENSGSFQEIRLIKAALEESCLLSCALDAALTSKEEPIRALRSEGLIPASEEQVEKNEQGEYQESQGS
ncbi:hypothetical protein F4677DRAFT_446435 [Hypoxylon crocopeplum]|nr:hypothetical protein F4677DRAFT_446435 [Hypoxylon crocopeplum]